MALPLMFFVFLFAIAGAFLPLVLGYEVGGRNSDSFLVPIRNWYDRAIGLLPLAWALFFWEALVQKGRDTLKKGEG